MFLTGVVGMLAVYIGWIIAMQKAMEAVANNTTNKGAGIAVLFFIYLYSLPYNIGNNALTYSTPSPIFPEKYTELIDLSSLPNRTIPLRRTLPRHLNRAILRARRRILHQLHKPHRHARCRLEISHHVHRHDPDRNPDDLVLLPRHQGPNFGRTCILYVS
jgi:hypothetical protein